MTGIDNKIEELLEHDMEQDSCGKWNLTPKMKELIHEIGEACKESAVAVQAKDVIPEWIEDATPEDIYIHMLAKIYDAPTMVHMICVPRILIPIIDDKLQGK